jgi:hypothetical protein
MPARGFSNDSDFACRGFVKGARLHAARAGRPHDPCLGLSREGRAAEFLGDVVRGMPRRDSASHGAIRQVREIERHPLHDRKRKRRRREVVRRRPVSSANVRDRQGWCDCRSHFRCARGGRIRKDDRARSRRFRSFVAIATPFAAVAAHLSPIGLLRSSVGGSR